MLNEHGLPTGVMQSLTRYAQMLNVWIFATSSYLFISSFLNNPGHNDSFLTGGACFWNYYVINRLTNKPGSQEFKKSALIENVMVVITLVFFVLVVLRIFAK